MTYREVQELALGVMENSLTQLKDVSSMTEDKVRLHLKMVRDMANVALSIDAMLEEQKNED